VPAPRSHIRGVAAVPDTVPIFGHLYTDEKLGEVVANWPLASEAVKATILEILRAVTSTG
jgi:hypothetical protein